jgi:RHS repeat-associated protein
VAGAANNLLPVSTTASNGTGTLTSSESYAYDAFSRLTSRDGPISGTADTSYERYDALGRSVGSIGPDPDGAGPRVRSAIRTSYNLDGQVTAQERGTVAGISDTDWTAFAALEKSQTTYDASGKATRAEVSAGATTYAIAQYGYDTRDRLLCAAQRLNYQRGNNVVAVPVDACTPDSITTAGPDRITQYGYDDASQRTSVIEAYGVTGVQRTAQTLTYGLNGQLLSFTDAKGNKTAYTYDGHLRPKTTIMPSKTTAGQVEATDYVETFYLANGDMEKQRLRDGQIVNVQYDSLGRITLQDVPDADRDVTPSYDNLGRVTALTLPGSNAARSVSTSYDIFGRITSATTGGKTVTYEYDPGFLWSRLVYPDGLRIQYTSNVLGQVTSIAEVNAAGTVVQTLATYVYDDLGRRTSVTYGNGAVTSYGFTPISQLASLTHNLAGTANDVAFTFSYNAAGQMLNQGRDNDVYAWANHFNVTRPYTANGQNQYTQVGTAQPQYDGRGNLKSDGLYKFSFDTAGNFIDAQGPQSMALAYDALGRLAQTASSASTTNFLYDGDAMIGEYDGAGTLVRRTIHGPGTDEPIVVYEGGVRKWLIADPRGSIIATTDSTGTATATNSYGPWGEEGLAMSGRFGYTGQMRIPELGLMHYKARAYSPRYGRFLQPDPIGTDGGLNVYEYAGSDPVNNSDPSGLACNGTYSQYVPAQGSGRNHKLLMHPA